MPFCPKPMSISTAGMIKASAKYSTPLSYSSLPALLFLKFANLFEAGFSALRLVAFLLVSLFVILSYFISLLFVVVISR